MRILFIRVWLSMKLSTVNAKPGPNVGSWKIVITAVTATMIIVISTTITPLSCLIIISITISILVTNITTNFKVPDCLFTCGIGTSNRPKNEI